MRISLHLATLQLLWLSVASGLAGLGSITRGLGGLGTVTGGLSSVSIARGLCTIPRWLRRIAGRWQDDDSGGRWHDQRRRGRDERRRGRDERRLCRREERSWGGGRHGGWGRSRGQHCERESAVNLKFLSQPFANITLEFKPVNGHRKLIWTAYLT